MLQSQAKISKFKFREFLCDTFTWKAERDLYAPLNSVGVPVFAEKISEGNCIEYCGFCPHILVQQGHVLNLTRVSNPIIILRTT